MIEIFKFVPVEIMYTPLEPKLSMRLRDSYTVEDYLKFANACEGLYYEYNGRGKLRQACNYAHTRFLMLLKAALVANGFTVALDEDDVYAYIRILEMSHPDLVHCIGRHHLEYLLSYGNHWNLKSHSQPAIYNYQNASKILYDYVVSITGEWIYQIPTLESSTVFAAELNIAYEDILMEKGYSKVIEVSKMFASKNILETIHNLPNRIELESDNRIDYIINLFG